MQIIKTNLNDCFVIKNTIHEDNRGVFMETYQKKKFEEKLGIKVDFVQDNFSLSKKGVLRGLHFQSKFPQGKLIRVLRGKVLDVAVDIRKNSETFGSHFCLELSGEDNLQFWVPEGFAHGFLSLTDETYFEYKCTNYYYKEHENTIYWNDPDLNIPWPKDIEITTSDKDENAEGFKKIFSI